MRQTTIKPATARRGIIHMTDGGKVTMPQTDVWMTREEIADMFGLPEATIFRSIRSIYRNKELFEFETMEKMPFPRHESDGWTIETYNLDMIFYLTYKTPSRNAQILRKYMMNKAYDRNPYEHICIIVDDVDFRSNVRSRPSSEQDK